MIRVVEVAKLFWFLKQQTDITEVRTFLQNSIIEHTILVHDMNLSRGDEVHIFRCISCFFNNGVKSARYEARQFHIFKHLFVFDRFWDNVVKLSAAKDFSHEFDVTLLKSKLKHLVIILENAIQYLYLQSWLKDLENLSFLHHNSIKPKLL